MPQTVRSRVGQLLPVSSLMHRHWGKGPCDAKWDTQRFPRLWQQEPAPSAQFPFCTRIGFEQTLEPLNSALPSARLICSFGGSDAQPQWSSLAGPLIGAKGSPLLR